MVCLEKGKKPPQNRGGFSLIESAIVLGVVGLVIGGIWVAAAEVNAKAKVDKTITDVNTTMENLLDLVSYENAVALGNAASLYEFAREAAVPDDWNRGSGYARDPSYGTILAPSIALTTPVPRIRIAIHIPPQYCTRATLAFLQANIYSSVWLYQTSGSVNHRVYPTDSLATIQAECAGIKPLSASNTNMTLVADVRRRN